MDEDHIALRELGDYLTGPAACVKNAVRIREK
jgi:hypothetical protein